MVGFPHRPDGLAAIEGLELCEHLQLGLDGVSDAAEVRSTLSEGRCAPPRECSLGRSNRCERASMEVGEPRLLASVPMVLGVIVPWGTDDRQIARECQGSH